MLIPKIRPHLVPQPNARSDLTFKIVKTADNNMSIVKKSDHPPPTTVVANISFNTGNTTTTTSPSLPKNEVEATKVEEPIGNSSPAKNINMNPKVLVAKDNTMQRYQVMHRKSVDLPSNSPGHTDDGKVKAVILKRKSMGTSSKKRIRSPSVETVDEKDKPKKIALESVATEEDTNSVKECINHVATLDKNDSDVTEKSMSPTKDEIPEPKSPKDIPDELPAQTASALVVQPDDASMFIPMMEIKNEVVDEDEQITLSSNRSSLNATGLSSISNEVKLEPMSEDEQLDGDDILTETTITPIQKVTIEITTPKDTITTPRGNINVKDMSKLKNPPSLTLKKHLEPQSQPLQPFTVVKSVFKRAKTKDPNASKGLANNRSNQSAQQSSKFSSMVYIPMGDGKQFTGNDALVSKPKDQVTNNTNYLNNSRTIIVSQPPPLTSVSPATSTIQTITSNSNQSTYQLYQPSPEITNPATTMNYITSSCPPPLVASLSNAQTAHTNLGPSLVIQPIPTPAGGLQPRSISPVNHFLGDMIPDNLARAVTDTLARGTPPRLVAKPTGALRSDGVSKAHNMDAGPVSKMLIDNSHKVCSLYLNLSF